MVNLIQLAREIDETLEKGFRLQMELGEVPLDPETACWTIWRAAKWSGESAWELGYLGNPSLGEAVSALDTASAKLRNALDRYRCACTE